jgi:hypothetical protein
MIYIGNAILKGTSHQSQAAGENSAAQHSRVKVTCINQFLAFFESIRLLLIVVSAERQGGNEE